MFSLATLLPSLVPAGVDLIKGAVNHFFPQPETTAEKAELLDAGTRRLQALATLDKPVGEPSQWVIDLRASARYIACYVLMINAVVMLNYGENIVLISASVDMGASAFSFLFGDRMWNKIKGVK